MVLNWEPRYDLREGLAKTIEYFRNDIERSEKNGLTGCHKDNNDEEDVGTCSKPLE